MFWRACLRRPDNRGMRTNLIAPYADKDKVKALGARWDATRKLWYVENVADLTPFARWLETADSRKTMPAAAGAKASAAMAPSPSKPAAQTGPAQAVADCGCAVLPWENCAHSGGA